MATRDVSLKDVREGKRSRLRLLAPLRYLAIRHPEKTRYDFLVPLITTLIACGVYYVLDPKPQIFGENGILRFARDFLIMAVPFMVGALAAVAMGAPGSQLDRRFVGTELMLDGEVLTMRQFVCYLLGYLCFIAIVTLIAVVGASLLRETIVHVVMGTPRVQTIVFALGFGALAVLLSSLTVTVLWSLYFLTDLVNRKN